MSKLDQISTVLQNLKIINTIPIARNAKILMQNSQQFRGVCVCHKVTILLSVFLLAGCFLQKPPCKSAFTVTFSGKVIDNQGAPISSVPVFTVDQSGQAGQIATTDSTGNYVFGWDRYVPIRDIRLKYSKTGYQDYLTELETFGESCSDQNVVKNITLTP